MAKDPLEIQNDPNLFLDVVAAPFRGLEGMAKSTYNLADYVAGDILPDWDTRALGTSQTAVGGIVEGATQFVAGFVPILGVTGRVGLAAGKLAKAGSLAQKAAQSRVAQSAVAGIATDFTAFSEQEQRLSNLIQQFPALQNPVTEFLATKDDDTVLEGRFKNALEGLGLGMMVDGVFRGVKAMKKGMQAKSAGGDADVVSSAVREQLGDDPESLVNSLIRQEEPTLPRTDEDLIDDTIKEETEVTAPRDEPKEAEKPKAKEKDEVVKVSLREDPEKIPFTDQESKGKAEEYANDLANRYLKNVGGIGKGGVVNFGSTADRVGVLEFANKAVRENEKVTPPTRPLESIKDEVDATEEAINVLPASQAREYRKAIALKDKGLLQEIRVRATSFRMVTESYLEEITDIAKNMVGISDIEKKAQVAALVEDLYEYVAIDSQIARQFGLGLRETALFRNKKVKVNPVQEIKMGGRVFSEQWMRDKKKAWIDRVVDILQRGGNKDEVMRQILSIADSTKGGKFDMLREFWINNLLAGLPTQSVNIMGGMLTMALDTFEQSAGALLAGRPDIAKAAIKAAVDMDTWMESFRWSKRALTDDKQFLIPNSNRALDVRPEAAITSEAMGIRPDSAFYDTFNTMAQVLRWPSRGLTGADEFFKQLNARRAAKYKATLEAIEEGATSSTEIAQLVKTKLEKIVTEGGELYSERTVAREGFLEARRMDLNDEDTIDFVAQYVKDNFDESKSLLSNYGKDVAEELTFTKDLDPKSLSGGFHKLVTQNPVLSFIFPFIRTPVNILTYAADRSLVGLINPRNMKPLKADILSGDPLRKAKALGKITTTFTAMGAHIGAMLAFSDKLTGGGPRDAKARKSLEDAGWQPYSIKVGDSWVSYQRLDPLATVIGIYADVMDMMKENWEFNRPAIEKTLFTLMITLQRNITNKSYLAGMEQFTQAMSDESGRGIERLFGNIAVNSTVPLAGFWRTTGREVVGEIMDANDVKELRNTVDKFRIYSPTGSGVRLDPRRNLLGEAKETQDTFNVPFANAISPIRYKTAKTDAVLEEIAALDHGFTTPSPSYRGLIDLTSYENEKGQSAHDRRLELTGTVRIGGKTLRQALDKLIKSREYQQHSPRSEPALPSPRIRMINSVLSKYRAEGLDRALREYPELQEFHRQYKDVQRRQKQGQALDNLINTLEF